jgi:hypothetical protein
MQQEIDYLGHTVTEHYVKLRKKNLKTLTNMQISDKPSDVRTFLGLSGYY